MAREYTLASAGGADFVRPMELLMQMVHERYNQCVHLDAWSMRNQDVRFGLQHPVLNLVIPFFPGSTQGQAGMNALPRCGNLWRSTMTGVPQRGALRRWDSWEDWDRGYQFGTSHDVRLNFLSDMLQRVQNRYVENEDPEDVLTYNHLGQSASPKSPTDPEILRLGSQLTTVNHLGSSAGNFTFNTRTQRLAMPIAGQGLLSQVRIVASGSMEGLRPTSSLLASWQSLLPADSLSPHWPSGQVAPYPARLANVTDVRLQVCENDEGDPGEVVATTPLLWDGGTLTPRFYFHRPLWLDHTKIYWLVVDAPLLDAATSYTVGLSNVEHEDTTYQLKTWNGTAWVNHAQPAIEFSLHMPKFMWRCKQLWNRADELKQLAHYRRVLHSKQHVYESGLALVNPPEHPNNDDRLAALRSGPYEYMTWFMSNKNQMITDFLNTDGGYYGSGFDTWGFPQFGWSSPISVEYRTSHAGSPPLWDASVGGVQIRLRERPPVAWKTGNYRCARFEYRTGVYRAAIDVDQVAAQNWYKPHGVFEVDEVLTLTGGLPGGSPAQLKVESINEEGLPTSLLVIAKGAYVKLDTPQRGRLADWSDGTRFLTFQLSMEVTEVIIVDGGSGYTSDCPVQLSGSPGVPYWIDIFEETWNYQYARIRGHNENGSITSVTIEDPGVAYGEGGIGTSLELLGAGSDLDPSSSTIWPGVRYYVNSNGPATTMYEPQEGLSFFGTGGPSKTGYEYIGGDATHIPRISYNGQDYCAGQSFVGVAGVSEFTWLEGQRFVSAGIEGWCHQVFGCSSGAKHAGWAGVGSLLGRATTVVAFVPTGFNTGFHVNATPRLLPPFCPKPMGRWSTLALLENNGPELVGVMLGAPPKFTDPIPDVGAPTTVSGVRMLGAVYFAKPVWVINLDAESEGGNGVAGPGGGVATRIPEGLALIRLDTDDIGIGDRVFGAATIPVDAFGDASLQDIQNAEGEAEIDVDPDGEADNSPAEIAELDVDADGEASQIEAQNGEGEGEIDVDAEGEAAGGLPPTPPSVIPDLWWPFEGDGLDASGSGYHLTESAPPSPTEVPTYATGKVGDAATTCANMSAVASYFYRNPNCPEFATHFTCCGWAKVAGDNGAHLFEASNSANALLFYLKYGEGWSLKTSDSEGVTLEELTCPTGPVAGTWYFWAFSYDHSTKAVKIYIDGLLAAEAVWTTGITGGSAWTMGLGQAASATHMDEVGRFPAVLSATDIDWIYNAGAGRDFQSFAYLMGTVTLAPATNEYDSYQVRMVETTTEAVVSAGENMLVRPGTYRAEVYSTANQENFTVYPTTYADYGWCGHPQYPEPGWPPSEVTIEAGETYDLSILMTLKADRASLGQILNWNDLSGYAGAVSYPSNNSWGFPAVVRYTWVEGEGSGPNPDDGYAEASLGDYREISADISGAPPAFGTQSQVDWPRIPQGDFA